jgi:hypothetical protein
MAVSYYDNPLYCVRIQSTYSILTYYNRLENVKELAKYLNDRVAKYPSETILEVTLCEGYNDKGIPILTKEEYDMQYFYETYELRLLSKYRLTLAV